MQTKTNRRSFTRPAVFEGLETRQLMAASAVKVIDSGGPIDQVVEVGGQIVASSQHASGSGVSQIYVSNGIKKKTRLLVDLTAAGSTLSSIDDLTATNDGRVFFTASKTGGRHLFELSLATGAVTQITSGNQVFYSKAKAAGNKVFFVDSTNETIHVLDAGATSPRKIANLRTFSDFKTSGSDAYFIGPDEQLYRTNGTAAGTKVISGSLTVSPGDIFATNEHVYFEGRLNNNTSLYRVGAADVSPVKIADDFALDTTDHAELGEHVYLGGFFYSTSPNSKGRELYRVKISDGTIELASDVSGSGSEGVKGITAIGNSIYFVNSDGEFINSQGTGDRELYRYDTIKKTTTLITKSNELYPISVGGSVLGSYYFVAAPSKDDARFGSRVLYRTNPVTDEIERVGDQPIITNNLGKQVTDVKLLNVGSRGLFFTASSADLARDTDVYFVLTPFSQYDPKTTILTIQATEGADNVTMAVDGDELVVTLNGIEERHELAKIKRIEAFLKDGNDTFTADANVLVNTYVFGDTGDDRITTGSGEDTISGGAGKNVMFGGAGNDRINGSNGRDTLDGQEGDDRLYGKGGGDDLTGGAGVDRLFGDDENGPAGDDILRGGASNDKLYGYGGNDSLYGQRQNDLLFGGEGIDLLDGGDGNDSLDGQAGEDQLFGGIGDDILTSKDIAKDSLNGGDGEDEAIVDASEKLLELIEKVS